jgi:hypothetical protein
MATDSPSLELSPDDFRARRNYLPDEAFALVTGSDEPPTAPMPADQWHELMDLPTHVLLRTTDHQGAQLAQLHDLWGRWVETLPLKADLAPYIFNAGWDAADDFNAAVFVAAHGYYRQGMANLRSALEGLTTAASFAVHQDRSALERWLSGQDDPPRPVEVRRVLAPTLGPEISGILKRLYRELSGYVHSQPSATNAVLWGGSNGPVWERDSFHRVYCCFRDVIAMGFVLLAVSWPSFSISRQLLPLFQGRVSAWKDIPPETLMQWSDG